MKSKLNMIIAISLYNLSYLQPEDMWSNIYKAAGAIYMLLSIFSKDD